MYEIHTYTAHIRTLQYTLNALMLHSLGVVDTCTYVCTFNSALYDEYMRIYACITYIRMYIHISME